MEELTAEQVRHFRLHQHHLDTWYPKDDLMEVAGACGFQNSPPGAWELALHDRMSEYSQEELRNILETEKTLIQAWSFRGNPVVFPTSESDVFLSALTARGEEPWIYTRGIGLALDHLGLSFDELLKGLIQVIPGLDGRTIQSKGTLDQTLALWMVPYLPTETVGKWNAPSMYGNPKKQTVGGAVVSFLLRPCAFMGLVVFGERRGISPTFTSYRNWIGHALEERPDSTGSLVRKYLHCYGPATMTDFRDWLGASSEQAQRMWQTVAREITPVLVSGKKCFILTSDQSLLMAPPPPARRLHLLSSHDPYLGLADRSLILDDKHRQRMIWQTISNPGAVLQDGTIAGIWRSKKNHGSLEVDVTLWAGSEILDSDLKDLAEDHARFQQCSISHFHVTRE